MNSNVSACPISFKPLDSDDFRKKPHIMVDFVADYYKNIENYPVLSQVEPGYLKDGVPENAPQSPESLETILEDVKKHILPGITHWQSPDFFGFFPLSVSTAAFLGEMICTGFNCGGFNWIASPAFTELEMAVLDWVAKMLNLPKCFMFSGTGGGVLQGTTAEAVLCAVVAAREHALEKIGVEKMDKLVVYESDQTHLFFRKVCKMAGIFPRNIRLIPTTREANFSMCPTALSRQIEADVAMGLVPFFMCATVGTTSTTAVDPVADLARVANDHDVWIHVDAAYAGSACICPEFRHYLDGIDRVDSLSLGTQKWLLSGMDCACLWVKKPDLMVKALSTDPEYMKNQKSESRSVVDFKDWQIGTCRRFRAIRLWLVLRSYGIENLQNHIRSGIRMATTFEQFVTSDPMFELVVPRAFSLVCFRIKPFGESSNAELINKKLLEMVNSTGRVLLSPTKVGGVYMLRFVVGAALTQDRHIISAWELIKETANVLLEKYH